MELTEKRKTGSPAELAIKLGVTERTVYNIMESLRCTEAGIAGFAGYLGVMAIGCVIGGIY